MEDDVQGRMLGEGTWSIGIQMLVLGTIVTVVSVAYMARYLADGRIKTKQGPFDQKSSDDERTTTEKNNSGADDRVEDANGPIIYASEVASKDLIIPERFGLENDGLLIEVGAEIKELNDVGNNEYRRIVDDEEYIDLCPQSNAGSNGKRRIIIVNNSSVNDSSVNGDKSPGLDLIEEEIDGGNPFTGASSNSSESVPFECRESIYNPRSLVLNENALVIDTSSMKCGTTGHRHVYNGLENTSDRSGADDKKDSHLANEFSLSETVDDETPCRTERQLAANETSDDGSSGVVGLKCNDISSTSRQCIPTLITSDHSDAVVDRNHNIDENVTLKRHQPDDINEPTPLKIDLGLRHVLRNAEETDVGADDIEDNAKSQEEITLSHEMATPEDIASFYHDKYEDGEETSTWNIVSRSNNADFGEMVETSFVTVIPNSLHDDCKHYEGNEIFHNCNTGPNSGRDNLLSCDKRVLTESDEEAREHKGDDMFGRTDNDNAEDNNVANCADDDDDWEGVDEEEDSDESGGLETIEEVSEEESFDDDDDTLGSQPESTSDVTENTDEAPAQDTISHGRQHKELLKKNCPVSEPDITEEHFDVPAHEIEECYSVTTDTTRMPDIQNLKNLHGSDFTFREIKPVVWKTNLGSGNRTDMENDFVYITTQNGVKLLDSTEDCDVDRRSENVQKNIGGGGCLYEFDLTQTSEERDLDDNATAKREVHANSHGNDREVTQIELAFHREKYDIPRTDLIKEKRSDELNDTSQHTVSYKDGSTIDESNVSSVYNPIYGTSHSNLSTTSGFIPFVAIKELDKIRPLPFLTKVACGTVDAPTNLNKPSFDDEQGDIIDSACVDSVIEKSDIQHESLHGQIEPEEPVDTTTIESHLDFETSLSTHSAPIGDEDNRYIDDVCKYDLTLPSQCSRDQARADQIIEQTGKQTITIELHLLRRNPNSIDEAEAPSAATEQLVCPASADETAPHPPQEQAESKPENPNDDETASPTITADVSTTETLEEAEILRNADKQATRQGSINDSRPSNDAIPASLESVTSDSTGNNRKLSVHEKRVLDSLKNLQLPEWYKKSDVHKRKMKNMAEGKILRSDSGTVYGPNRFYGRQHSSSFGSDESDFRNTKPKPVSTRMSYERKAKYYYSAQHLAVPRPSDDYRSLKVASASYLKTQSNYDIRRLDSEKKQTSVLNAARHSDEMFGKEVTDQSRITERPQSESDLVNMDPIPMNNFKIQRQRSNKGTATFYITSVHVQNKNAEQKQTDGADDNRGSDSGINGGANTMREDNNVIDQLMEINKSSQNNRDDLYPEDVVYKHRPYTYKLVYGTPKQTADYPSEQQLSDGIRGTSPDSTEFYTESDHIEYYASIVQCQDDKISDRSSINQSNLSPDITNDSAINLDNNMSSGQDSESFHSYGGSTHSSSMYVPSVTHSGPPFVENKQKPKPTNFQQNTWKAPGRGEISSSVDNVLNKQEAGGRMNRAKSRTSTEPTLGLKSSPRFPVINRSRDNLVTNGKKNGISISITDTHLDDHPKHRVDVDEFEKHLHEPDQKTNSDGKDKAVVMENIIDGLLGLTTPSVNNSSNFSYNESALSSSSHLLSSESDSSVSASARHKQNDPVKKQNSTSDDKNHIVHCRNCRTSANLVEAKKSFKNCHHCYTYYCSRDCRIEHWDQHKQRCIFARVSSSCKRAIAVCRDDGSTHYTLSKIARTCYLSHGRGSILIVFPNEIAARLFVHYGLRAIPSPPSYITVRELEKTQEPNEHTNSLLSVCQAYDPNQSFIINVIVNIGIEIPKKPVPRRQGTAIKKCANFSLCETHVAQPSTRANETTGETLILTMPPGLPPDGTRDRKLRQVCFVNIQRHLRQREVKLRHQFPSIYSALCRWVEYHESFPPTTIYPKEGNTDRPFMCLIMPESDPDALGWVTNPGLLEDIDMDGEFE